MVRNLVRHAAVVLLAVLLPAVGRAQPENIKAAQEAAEAWLALVDKEDYAAGWAAMAPFFRSAVPSDRWQAATRAARAPLGPMTSRELRGARVASTLPGLPDGDYVVFQFTTAFEQKPAALENVTAMRGDNGVWRVVGYIIR